MGNDNWTCAACRREATAEQTPFEFEDYIVCKTCYERLSKRHPARNTGCMGAGYLLIGLAALVGFVAFVVFFGAVGGSRAETVLQQINATLTAVGAGVVLAMSILAFGAGVALNMLQDEIRANRRR